MSKGKYLGIDFGDKRVGIAISDFNKDIAFSRGFLTYKNEGDLTDQIKKICEEDMVVKIILGLPLMMNGELGDRAKKTQLFYDQLKKALDGMMVEFFDERLSTEFAIKSLRGQGIRDKNQKGGRDAMSAQIILQNYLNSIR